MLPKSVRIVIVFGVSLMISPEADALFGARNSAAETFEACTAKATTTTNLRNSFEYRDGDDTAKKERNCLSL